MPRENLNEHPSLKFSFVKANRMEGAGIVNSMQTFWYSENRPDRIRFTQGTVLEALLQHSSAYPLYRMPPDYSHESGNYEIDAKYSVGFLETLASMKHDSPELVLEKNVFLKLIDDLIKNNYLTESQGQYYLAKIPTELTLEERCNLAKEKHDFAEAAFIANFYRTNKGLFSAEKSIYWLYQTIQFKPAEIDLNKVINIEEFMSSVNEYYSGAIFSYNCPLLLAALKKIDPVTKISFGVFFDPKNVNQNLADYLASTHVLKTLDISTTWSQDYDRRLCADHMRYIASGLKFNTSLETLDISDQPIGDEGLAYLLAGLAENSNTKLKTLNLFSTRITAKGYAMLEEFLKTNHSLEHINLGENDCPSFIQTYNQRYNLRPR